jgi:hypothetical protein
MSWGTVAGGIVGRTVKDLTAVPGTERVGIRCEGVAPFRAQFILKKDAVNKISSPTGRFGALTVCVVRVGREGIAKEERLIQRLCLGDLDGLHISSPVSFSYYIDYCANRRGWSNLPSLML